MIQICPSTIPDAGYGVFALVDIPVDTTLEYYTGTPLDIDHCNPPSSKLMTLTKRPPWWPSNQVFPAAVTIDGDVGGNWTAMINDSVPNVDFDESGRFFTIRKIKMGEELFVRYGTSQLLNGPVSLC